MSEASKKAEQAIALFRTYRMNQLSRLVAMQKLADIVDAEMQAIANHAGADPISELPIFRLVKQIPDYNNAWGLVISPIGGLSVSLILERSGMFSLKLGDTQYSPELIHDDSGTVVAAIPPGSAARRVSDILLEFLAGQLEQAVEKKSII